MNVVLVGDVCIDHNVSEHTSYSGWGSALMYMAHNFRDQLAINPTLVASYCKDFVGYLADLTIIPAIPDRAKTLAIENISQAGHRHQRYQNADGEIDEISPAARNAVGQADIVIVAPLLPNWPASYVCELLSHRQADSLAMLLPQGYFRSASQDGDIHPRQFAEAADIVPLFDLVIFSEEDCPDPESEGRLLSRYGATIIITQGSKGASQVTEGGLLRVPTEAVAEEDIIDSVGCGDIFGAALAHDYFLHRSVTAAIKAGNTAARARLFQARSGSQDARID